LHGERDHVAEEQALDLDRIDVGKRHRAQNLLDRASDTSSECFAGFNRQQAFLGEHERAGRSELDSGFFGSAASFLLRVPSDCRADSEGPASSHRLRPAARAGDQDCADLLALVQQGPHLLFDLLLLL